MNNLFTYQQAASGEMASLRQTLLGDPGRFGTAGGILVCDPTNDANFALIVYDFERSNSVFSITQEHLGTEMGAAAFCEMAAQGNIPILETLLSKGMDVNARNERGVTALAIAIARGQLETVEFLLRKQANPNIVYFDSFASLQQAIEQYLLGQQHSNNVMINGYKRIIDSLLSNGADVKQAKRLSSKARTTEVSAFLEKL